MQMSVLGPIGAELEQPVALGGPTQRRVLAVLALHAGDVVSVDRLVDAVWPDGDAPERADHNVRTYVHRLRSALGEEGRRIETAGNGYRLHLERHELDASRFEDLVAEGRAAAARDDHDDARRCFDEALALWGGRPYDEFADEEWARAEVARLDELRASAVEHRNAALLDAGRHTEVIGELRDAATEQPWREVRRMQLAVALYRSGRQAEALQVLRDYRTGLVEELGLDPSPELGRLEHRILEHDPDLLPPSHRRHDLRGYRLEEVVGEGSFALVWRGVQPSLGRTVAVKQIRAELANHPDFVRRFETEAQTVAMLEHPHIVPLYDYWREPDGAYLVMRYVSGGSLESEVLHGGLDELRLRRFVEQAGSALEAAHRLGVIHRDVKAANVLLDDNGNFYLTDFGIAFIGSAVDDELATSLSTGSPAYASPEQLRRQVLDIRTDVYGFGITLFEAATGRLPFADAPNEAALVRRQLDDPVPAPSSVEPSVPRWVDEVVARATAKNPADRYASMAELMAAVAPQAVAPVDMRYRLGSGTVVGELVNPFKALRAFREADTADFFGRNRLVARFIEVLSQPGSAGRLLAVVGPSGSGKSSVVRSGLVPRLRRGGVTGSADWFITTMLPGNHPFDEFESALSRVAVRQPGPLVETMRSDERGIARAVNQILPDEDSELLVVIDQFEELFTHGNDTERTAFVNGLVAALREPRARLRVVLTIRADFWDRPLRHPSLAARLEKATVTVPPLAADELEAAIVEPVHRQGASYEPGLVARIMADVRDQPGALPLLQYALTELFDANVSGLIRTESYDAIGGLTGALAMRAEQTFTAMPAGQQVAARRLFGRLVSLGEGTEDTRRRVRLGELGHDTDTEAVIAAFGEARLLVFDHEPATREPTVEVAHEALIRAWPRLQTWLDEDRDGLRIHRHLTETTTAWLASGRDDGELYRGGRLEAVTEYAVGASLTADEQAFFDASVAAAEAEDEAERRRVTRLRRLALALGVVAALALGAGFVAVGQQQRADDNATEARAASALAETQAERATEAAEDAAEQAERAEGALADAEIATLISRSAALVDENPAASLLLAAEVYDREPSNRTTAALADSARCAWSRDPAYRSRPDRASALRGRLRLAHVVPADRAGRTGWMARGRSDDRHRPHDRRNPCPHHAARPVR
jgi:DNA-binding SARP family transcriptional activator